MMKKETKKPPKKPAPKLSSVAQTVKEKSPPKPQKMKAPDLKSVNLVEDAKAAPSSDQLKEVRTLAQKMIDYAAAIAEVKEQLAALSEEHEKIAFGSLPSLMDSIGIKTFALTNGLTISVDDFITANIPSQTTIAQAIAKKKPNAEELASRRERALDWLRENDAESLIKNYVACQFGKGEAKRAAKLLRELRDAGYDPEQEESVNPSTLTAWVKERMEAGKVTPIDLFAIRTARKASVSK